MSGRSSRIAVTAPWINCYDIRSKCVAERCRKDCCSSLLRREPALRPCASSVAEQHGYLARRLSWEDLRFHLQVECGDMSFKAAMPPRLRDFVVKLHDALLGIGHES
jgi:hypothetical protein